MKHLGEAHLVNQSPLCEKKINKKITEETSTSSHQITIIDLNEEDGDNEASEGSMDKNSSSISLFEFSLVEGHSEFSETSEGISASTEQESNSGGISTTENECNNVVLTSVQQSNADSDNAKISTSESQDEKSPSINNETSQVSSKVSQTEEKMVECNINKSKLNKALDQIGKKRHIKY